MPIRCRAHILAFGAVGISPYSTLLSMLQLQTLRLQKQQRLYKLVGKALDVLNVLLVNFVRDICSVGDLVDVVCDITRKIAESLHLIFVNVDDVSFKDHRTGAILKK